MNKDIASIKKRWVFSNRPIVIQNHPAKQIITKPVTSAQEIRLNSCKKDLVRIPESFIIMSLTTMIYRAEYLSRVFV